MPKQQIVPIAAERFFTNRENYFEAFKNALSNVSKKDYSVLYFYGVGGIGKSRFKRELSKRLKSEGNGEFIVSDSLNFQEAGFRSPNAALYCLYTDLKRSKISFPAFEIAYSIHWQKLNPHLKISQSNLPFLEEGSIVSDFVSVLGDLPLVGLLPKVGTVYHKIKKGYTDWWIKKGEKELKVLETLEVFQIEELLPYYFALDLKEYYLTNQRSIVLFVDTYEALWSTQEERKSEKFFVKDKWIRNLIANLPNTLWVILGRERLRWDEIQDDNWGDYIEQHFLGELSSHDANKFLEACDIRDAEIREQIIQTSKGLPFYLDLQVDTYQRIIAKENLPVVNDFPKRYSDILSRFCLYLEPSEIETLKILSFARHWRYELFLLLIKEFQTGYPATSFNEILKFSFINSSTEDGTYSIHQIMQEHLQEAVPEEQKNLIQTFLFSYYNNQLNQENTDNQKDADFLELNASILSVIDEAIFQKRGYDTKINYYNWLLNTSRKFYGESNSNLLQDSLEKAFTELNVDETYLLLIRISSEIARLYGWKKNMPMTEKYIIAGLGLCSTRVSESNKFDDTRRSNEEAELIRLNTDLLIQQAELYNDLDKNVEAYHIYQQAFALGERVNYKPDKWPYSNLLLEIGKTPEAESYFYKCLRQAIDSQDKDLLAVVYTKIGTIFWLQHLYKEAGIYFNKSVDLYHELKGVDHKYYWICKKKYAETLIALERYDEANLILTETVNWYISKYGESYPDSGYVFLTLAKCQLQVSDFYNGLNNLITGINLLQSNYGSTHSVVIEGILLFCEAVQMVMVENIDLQEAGFTDEDTKSIFKIYRSFINDLEFGFYNNFDGLKMNFGLDSTVMNMYFKVMGSFYELQNTKDKRDKVSNRRIELDRISKSQSEIRVLEALTQDEIIGNQKKLLLEIFSRYLGVDENIPVTVFISHLACFPNTDIYTIVFSNKIKKYVLVFEDNVFFLDWTNAPIYDLGEKDFVLSPEMVKDYVYFFWDAVKGRHGKFYFPRTNDDIPYRLDLDVSKELKEQITEKVGPLSIIESTGDFILLKGSCFFKDSLFGCKLKIYKNGMIEMFDEELIWEHLPIAVDPQVETVLSTYEDILLRVTFFLKSVFFNLSTNDVVNEMDLPKLEETLYNIQLISDALSENRVLPIQLINTTLIDSVYLIDVYVKPGYDEFLFNKDIGVFLNFISWILRYNKSHSAENT